MNIEISFLIIHNLDHINRFKINNNNNNNNNKLLNSETTIKHFLIVFSTLKMLIQIRNKHIINQIKRISKEIFKINLDLFNLFHLDNHYNSYHY